MKNLPKIHHSVLVNQPWSKEEWLSPFDKIFDDIWAASNPELIKTFGDSLFEKNAYPKVNVVDFDDRVEIHASTPGLTEDDISIEISNGVLTLSGGATQNADQPGRFLKREIKTSQFRRSFALSDNLDASAISAKIQNGLLYLSIAKLKPTTQMDSKIKVKIQRG